MTSYFSQSNSDAPIAVKRRPDIVVEKVFYQGEPYWICKDPLDQEYQHLNEQEYAIFCWLDGTNSFNDIKEKFEREFPPFQVELRELAQLVGDLHEKSLLVSHGYDQGQKLLEMGREKFRKDLKQKLLSVYAIKWKGFDPERILNALNPWVTWYFSKRMVMLVMAATVIALLFCLMNYQVLAQRMPSVWDFLDPANLLTLGALVALTKLLHEFGHALAFKRFGGEVHEIGVMIFFFVPTMYCNTSDSWLLPNKWHRAAVGLGGIYVELTMLTIATFVWWIAPPGIVQDIAINLMFICSVGTVILNGNPLLKYDGYFVLADLVEIPNMSQKANEQIQKKFMVHAMGNEDEECLMESDWNKRFLIGYGMAAYLFKLSLMLTVAFMLVDRAKGTGLVPLAALFAAVTTIIYLATPLYKLGKQLTRPGVMLKTKRNHILITVGIVVTLLISMLIPYPFYVTADCNLDGGEAIPVVSWQSGIIEEVFAKPGDTVTRNQKIAQLVNHELDRKILETSKAWESKKRDYEAQRYVASSNWSNVSLDGLKNELTQLRHRLAGLERNKSELTIRATKTGEVIGIRHQTQQASDQSRQLSSKSINYLLDRRGNPYIESGTEICRIRPPGKSKCSLLIKQTDQDLITPGQTVYLLFADHQRKHTSKIESLSAQSENLGESVDFESHTRAAQTYSQTMEQIKQSDPGGDGMALETTIVKAICTLNDSTSVFGVNGVAKIHVGSRSMAWRIGRMIQIFINSKL